MTDRVQEPHGSPRVRGASHYVADDTHGMASQLTKTPIS